MAELGYAGHAAGVGPDGGGDEVDGCVDGALGGGDEEERDRGWTEEAQLEGVGVEGAHVQDAVGGNCLQRGDGVGDYILVVVGDNLTDEGIVVVVAMIYCCYCR